jgi:formylglycine-generating enzyme required for sulfatase activity
VAALFAESGYLSQFRSDVSLNPGVQKHSPVNNISWFAARAYCEQIGMRLPSTDEWEYMAAASETARDASGDAAYLTRILDWYSEPSQGHGIPIVGQRAANIYGIHDLHGLVWEWVEDFNASMTAGESRQGTTFSRDLFCGGGASYGGNRENYAAYMRFAFRSSLRGKDAVWNLGFRCVKSLEEKL